MSTVDPALPLPVLLVPPAARAAFAEMMQDLARRGSGLSSDDLLRVLRLLGQLIETIDRHRVFVERLEDRLLLVDELPASAPFGALIRLRVGTVAQRAALYLGNGAGQPLSRLVPVAI